MTPQERLEAIQKIEALPGQIEALVAGRSEQELDQTYGPGKWSARQVIHHLADAHMHAFIRTHFILTEEKPTLKPFDQNAWALLPSALGPVSASLAILKGMHARWAIFWRSLDEAQYARLGFHPERGDCTLESFLKLYSGHGVKHLEHIRLALKA
jgi:hypothetical protein